MDQTDSLDSEATATEGLKVLVVDDSRTMRRLLVRMLNSIGITDIAQAEHGEEALERLAEEIPDLAMVDWNMPVMNGLDFVKALRENSEWECVKVMMVTSETNPRQIYEALRAGADEYAMKPIDGGIITDKLAMLGLS